MTKPGKAADGIAKTEVDHHRKCLAAGSGSICATFVKCSSIFMTRATPITSRSSPPRTPRKNGLNGPEGVAFEYEGLE
jgi:hypothetical protein